MAAVSALITQGIGPQSTIFLALTGGLGPAAAVTPPAPEPTVVKKRGATYPGGWIPQKLYNPPRRKISKRKIEALKELYEEARHEIPEPLQHSLIPGELLRLRSRASAALLPPVSAIDFEALARSLETIRVLIAAVEAAYQAKTQADYETARAEEQKRLKRRRDEDALIMILMEI